MAKSCWGTWYEPLYAKPCLRGTALIKGAVDACAILIVGTVVEHYLLAVLRRSTSTFFEVLNSKGLAGSCDLGICAFASVRQRMVAPIDQLKQFLSA